MPRNTVLIVDDEPTVRMAIRDFLEAHRYRVLDAQSCREAEDVFRADAPDASIVDYRLADGTALTLLPRLKQMDPAAPLVILTGHGTIELAVQAIKEGADHFLTKPVELTALETILNRLIENRRSRQREIAHASEQARNRVDPFLGASSAIRQLAAEAATVAGSESPILIQGETGTGKGVLARWLHESSSRANEPLVDLNCGGLSPEFLETELFGHEKGAFTGAISSKPGLLEIAHRGTLFLDEIGDMDTRVQTKLLKVLEEKTFRRLGNVRDRYVDVRLISATHHNLQQFAQLGRFRSDLYFRISTIRLCIPPLRDRAEDIPVLARELLSFIGRRDVVIDNQAMAALRAYPWPGNIREMRNVLERAVLFSSDGCLPAPALHFDYFPLPAGLAGHASDKLEDVERQHIEQVLRLENGHVARAAERLGIPRSSLYNKIKQHRIRLSMRGNSW